MNIYLIRQNNSNLYKIGITGRKVEHRLFELQTANGNQIDIIHVFKTKYNRKVESALHRRYAMNNTIGEWFELTDKQVDEFLMECKKIEDNFDLLMKHSLYIQNLKNF